MKKPYLIVENILRSPKHHITYESMLNCPKVPNTENHEYILNISGGRSGTRWLSNVMDQHGSWIGSCERFRAYEAFYRYVTWYELDVDLGSFHHLFDLSVNHDLYHHGNSFLTTPFLNFNLQKICQLKTPTLLIYSIRDPVETIASFHGKGFYEGHVFPEQKFHMAQIDPQSGSSTGWGLSKTFSRILPRSDFSREEWEDLSRIGKCTWFWVKQNEAIYSFYRKVEDTDKILLPLENIDQNYDRYLKLSEKCGVDEPLDPNEFLRVKGATHPEPEPLRLPPDWNSKEKSDYESIMSKFEFQSLVEDYHSSYQDIQL